MMVEKKGGSKRWKDGQDGFATQQEKVERTIGRDDLFRAVRKLWCSVQARMAELHPSAADGD